MANTIASERKRLGMTQDELAEKVGRKRSTIVRWEGDPTLVRGVMLCKLADIFGCSVDYILGLTEERMPNGTSAT